MAEDTTGGELTEQTRASLHAELKMLRAQHDTLAAPVGDAGTGDRVDDAELIRRHDEAALLRERISELQHTLRRGPRPDEDTAAEEVLPDGAVVTVEDEDGVVDTVRVVALATATESDDQAVTRDSPLGRALAGHQPGDQISYDTPDGTRQVRILEVNSDGR